MPQCEGHLSKQPINRRTVQGPALPRSMTIGWGGVVSEKRMFCGFMSRCAYLGKKGRKKERKKEREKDRETERKER